MSKKRILIVDDDQDLRRSLMLLLAKEFEVREAADGEAGLRLAAGYGPHLLLLDMTMPGMTGLEVLKGVRAKCRAAAVLMFTAQTDLDLARQALDLGASAYITKPFDFGELLAEVKRILEGPSPEEENRGYRPWRVAGS